MEPGAEVDAGCCVLVVGLRVAVGRAVLVEVGASVAVGAVTVVFGAASAVVATEDGASTGNTEASAVGEASPTGITVAVGITGEAVGVPVSWSPNSRYMTSSPASTKTTNAATPAITGIIRDRSGSFWTGAATAIFIVAACS